MMMDDWQANFLIGANFEPKLGTFINSKAIARPPISLIKPRQLHSNVVSAVKVLLLASPSLLSVTFPMHTTP